MSDKSLIFLEDAFIPIFMNKKRYPSDLSDAQWSALHTFYEPYYHRQGRPPSSRLREIWNAILYVTRSGCSWRMLPKDFPHWKTVYHHFNKLKGTGQLEAMMHGLREKARSQLGREKSPSVGVIDSQSIKSRSLGKKRERV
jgi:putative transposase